MTTAFLELLEFAFAGSGAKPVLLAKLIHGLSSRIGGNRSDNEDYAQDLLVKIVGTPEVFVDRFCERDPVIVSIVRGSREPASLVHAEKVLERYFLTCFKNRHFDAYRSRARRKNVPLDEENTAGTGSEDGLKQELRASLARIEKVVEGLESERCTSDFRQLCDFALEGGSLRQQLVSEFPDEAERTRAYDATTKRHSRLRGAVLAGIASRLRSGHTTEDEAVLDRLVINKILNRRPISGVSVVDTIEDR